MKRPGQVEKTLSRIKAWREVCPDLTIRSTFIVGFPGETEAEFEELLAWLDEAQLDRVGAFKYSPVEGAPANDVAPHIPPDVQEERLARFMAKSAEISAAKLAAKVGKTMRVLVDAIDDTQAIARSEGDAPEIDGVVRIVRGAKLKIGEFADVEITASSDHDLEAKVLKRMKRPGQVEKTLSRIKAWREVCPDLTIRSTFIVGFPGETDSDFEMLLDWLDEAALDRVGCFRYEPVRGAPANDLADAVPKDVTEDRWHRFMQRQQKISARRLKKKVGTRQQVIIDEAGPARLQAEWEPVSRPEGAQNHKTGARPDAKPVPTFAGRALAKGRSMADAPEIDGAVYVASRRPLRVGEIVTVKIERADEYDLHGTAVGF
jgi:tRNA A37 methylthiotransferase MiaB